MLARPAPSPRAKVPALLARFTPANPEEHYFDPERGTDISVSGSRKPRTACDPHSVEVGRAGKRANAPHRHPNQLRYLFATRVRRLHGPEAAQVLLGHARADVTQIYAENNPARAAKVAAENG